MLSSKAATSEEAIVLVPYVEPLSEAGTPLAVFFHILLDDVCTAAFLRLSSRPRKVIGRWSKAKK